MTPRELPDLIEVSQEVFELPQRVSLLSWSRPLCEANGHAFKERVTYNKEIQTTAVETDDEDREETVRRRLFQEKQAEDERIAFEKKELEEESVQLEKEIEQEIRGIGVFTFWVAAFLNVILAELTEEERASILTAPEFHDFVEWSSKIVQRALNDTYDYTRDYSVNADAGGCVSLSRCSKPAID